MENFIKIHYWLYPFSWLYGTAVYLRNKLFDWGLLRSKSFHVPIICVGNIAVGGTGKTPHTEYLVKLLQDAGMNVATLSRGYKRKSKGYVLASGDSTVQQLGDEPYQIKSKFPDIQVAVDENRCRGIEELLKLPSPRIDAILLDDAFQYRHVKAGLTILLTDYHHLLCDDALLPTGRLREPTSGKNRADIVIVTKCPDDIKPIDFNIIGKRLDLYPYQQLYFSRFRYGEMYPLYPEQASYYRTLNTKTRVLLLTGIASPAPFLQEIKAHTSHITQMEFNDHHEYNKKDLSRLKEVFRKQKGKDKVIITTEKDAARLKGHPSTDDELKPHIYVMPIEVEILQDQQYLFNQNIIGYVRTNSRNGNLPEK